MINFTFNKLWYSTDELLEIIPLKRTTLYKFHREEIEGGRDGSDMGKVKIKGQKTTLWDPIKLLEYINKNGLLTKPVTYSHEQLIQDDLKVAIGVFNNKQQQQRKN
jgi:hypothetical protein|tara:strand:+ start:431 stop:748 length:318 start_codon:yes stop_codon:yes gene_type:complete